MPTLHVSNIKESEGGAGGRGRERVSARETEKEGESRRAEKEVVVGVGERGELYGYFNVFVKGAIACVVNARLYYL